MNLRNLRVTALTVVLAALQPALAGTGAVDFKNFTYRDNPCRKAPITVKDGSFSYFDNMVGNGLELHVFSVVRGSLRAGTRQAAVTLACDFPVGGASSAYLFDIHGGTAKLIAKVADAAWAPDWGIGPRAIQAKFKNGILTVTGCANPDCHSTSLVRYTIRNGKVAKLGSETIAHAPPTSPPLPEVRPPGLSGVQRLGSLTEFPAPAKPFSVFPARDGTVWFADYNKLVRMTPDGHTTEYPAPGVGSRAPSTQGPDGTLWFFNVQSDKIGRMSPSGKVAWLTQDLGYRGDDQTARAAPDGSVWFILKDPPPDGDTVVGRITPNGTLQKIPVSGAIADFAVAPDGVMWFRTTGARARGGKIGRITLLGALSYFTLPVNDDVSLGTYNIAVGSDGTVWFTEPVSGRIGTIAPSGKMRHLALSRPMAFTGPHAFVVAPDGTLWFGTERRIGKVSPSGEITAYPVQGLEYPHSFVSGSGGSLWFLDGDSRNVHTITQNGNVTTYALPSNLSKVTWLFAGTNGTIWFTDEIGGVGKIEVSTSGG